MSGYILCGLLLILVLLACLPYLWPHREHPTVITVGDTRGIYPGDKCFTAGPRGECMPVVVVSVDSPTTLTVKERKP